LECGKRFGQQRNPPVLTRPRRVDVKRPRVQERVGEKEKKVRQRSEGGEGENQRKKTGNRANLRKKIFFRQGRKKPGRKKERVGQGDPSVNGWSRAFVGPWARRGTKCGGGE